MELHLALIDAEGSLWERVEVTQLRRLGAPDALAEVDVDYADRYQVAWLVRRGCSPRLAVRIVRYSMTDRDENGGGRQWLTTNTAGRALLPGVHEQR